VLLASLIGCLLTARLGFWQLDRAAQKEAAQALIVARSHLPALAPAELARTPAEAAAQLQRRITLRGRWLGQATVFLDNRTMDGRTGFLVVTPLLLGPHDAVLVQRGWVPRHREERTRLPPVPTPDGEVLVQGQLAAAPSHLLELGGAGGSNGPASAPPDGPIRQNLDIDALARELDLPLRPLTLLQLDDNATTDATPLTTAAALTRHWPVPTANVQMHHGYATQWFALSALIAGLHVWFQIIRPRRQPRSA
jgi:surfeit locus 1 family protein